VWTCLNHISKAPQSWCFVGRRINAL
jgi:hypothetical protein